MNKTSKLFTIGWIFFMIVLGIFAFVDKHTNDVCIDGTMYREKVFIGTKDVIIIRGNTLECNNERN